MDACDRCATEDYDPRYSYPTRSGAMRCGECWAEAERLASFGAEVQRILAGAPKLLGWWKTDDEALALVKRAGARMGVLRRERAGVAP